MTNLSFSRIGAFAAVSFLTLVVLTACSSASGNRAEAEAYIRANVSELSPVPAVLGGTFYVTDIAWEDDDTALVSYEDGHIALTGRTDVVVGDGGVTATEFVVVDDGGHGSSAASAPGDSGSASSEAEKPRAAEGEACGGVAGIMCDFGLICIFDGAYPDAEGTCSK